jgi:[ribosomal protein S5]-alanine N-acetyltransferase
VRLEDGDIALRPFVEDDVPAIVAACQDPEIPRWTSVPSPYTDEDGRRFVAGIGNHRSFAVVDAKTDELLGSVGFDVEEDGRAEFGYWVVREARGRGVASRALLLLAHWAAREHTLARLQLIVDPANAASIRVAEKAGFQREGLLRSYIELKGTRRDVYLYSLLPEELSS